jgi:hypothetical protein
MSGPEKKITGRLATAYSPLLKEVAVNVFLVLFDCPGQTIDIACFPFERSITAASIIKVLVFFCRK